MRHKIAVGLAAVGMVVAIALVVPTGLDAADCSGSECVDCAGFECLWSATPGHCECSAGVSETGGKWCVASGSCIIRA